MLSGLTQLALEMARTFQAQAVAALAAGDLKRAGKAETRFSSLFLAIRRVVALNAKLRRQREQAVSPAAAEAAMLSELMELAMALATAFQALGVAALKAGDLDRAGDAETHFSSLFLGIRRAVALKIKLREQREKARCEAEQRRESRQKEKDDRRQAVAQGVAQAIAAAHDTDADAKEQLTVDLWEKLTEDERIDVDLADTALPIEALIASLCRALGLPPHWPGGAGPAGTGKAGPRGRPAGDALGTSGPPGGQHGASGTTAAGPEQPEAADAGPPEAAMAPPRPVPPPAVGGGQGGAGSGPPATAPPGEDAAGRKDRKRDRQRLGLAA
ncbi:hypothetical protein FFK22_020110 [Mycobacterium sp. KBS0706]|uniref:hypothetical protein n=1 Tax=Mycobacterium sp. KBS0706 TaxID=2578109 RepID=UPI001180F795|nr:hypothetical protein [Mycobacterium sp. KBS0706]TSD86900.1 hypothetical protein FFK22_020110 [Mycobacterium sp. KBS0706]